MIRIVFVLAAFLLCTNRSADAASFDCAKAKSNVEKLICKNAALSRLDVRLFSEYLSALKSSSNAAETKLKQLEWLRATRSVCKDILCLDREYRERIEELSSVVDQAACSAIAAQGSRYSDFKPLLADEPKIDKASEKQVEQILGGRRYGTPDPSTTYLWRIDFDSDGVIDYFAIDYGNGTMHIGRAYFLPGSGDSDRQEFDAYWDDTGALDLWLLQINGQFYVTSSTSTDEQVRLDRLWRISSDGKFMAVCKFEEAGISQSITEGIDNNTCKKISDNQLPYISYAEELKIAPSESDGNFFWSKYPKPGLAHADINNDGNAESIIRIKFEHGGGRGCGAQYLAALNKDNSLRKTPLNELLFDQLGGYPCGPDLDVIVDDGVTYIDAKGSLDRNVYRIKEMAVEKVCSFRGAVKNTFRMLAEP